MTKWRWLFGADGNPQSWTQLRDWVRMVLDCAARDEAEPFGVEQLRAAC